MLSRPRVVTRLLSITGGKTPDPQARTYQQILREKELAQQEVLHLSSLFFLFFIFLLTFFVLSIFDF